MGVININEENNLPSFVLLMAVDGLAAVTIDIDRYSCMCVRVCNNMYMGYRLDKGGATCAVGELFVCACQ